MTAKSLIDIPNKYNPSHEEDIIESHGSKIKRRTEIVKHFLAKAGDELTIITENPGEWCICVVVENKKGERFSVNWSDLDVSKAIKGVIDEVSDLNWDEL